MINPVYSIRNNTNPNKNGLPLFEILKLFLEELNIFRNNGLFIENLGLECPECGVGWQTGIFSEYNNDKFKSLIVKATYKPKLFPINEENILGSYNEDDFFDIIEFLSQYISAPVVKSADGSYELLNENSFGEKYCQHNHFWHSENFNKEPATYFFRTHINELLSHYSLSKPYQLSENGLIMMKADYGLNKIIESPLKTDDELIKSKVDHAIRKYLGRNSSKEDRVDAVGNLFNILEPLRTKMKKSSFSKDGDELFKIANNFAIRHNNDIQKVDYDPIWLSWMFYNCLSFIHVMLHLSKE